MERIALGENVSLSRITAGCMRTLDAGMDGEKLRGFVHACMEMGVDSFDHAPVYGAGRCEKIFGDEVIKKEPGIREQIKIVTKAGIILPGQKGNAHIYYDSSKKNLLEEIDASLERLSTDHVDLFLVHRPDAMIHPQETAEALEMIVSSGKALQVGVSNYEPAQFEALQAHCSVKLAANQMEFSVKSVDNFFNGVTDTAQRLGTALMAWSPLGGGSVFRGEDEQSLRLRGELEALADAHGVSVDVVMYAFLLQHPVGMMVVTGTMNQDRVRRAVEALEVNLTRDEWYGILAASRGFDVP